jgi:hypothetical protein
MNMMPVDGESFLRWLQSLPQTLLVLILTLSQFVLIVVVSIFASLGSCRAVPMGATAFRYHPHHGGDCRWKL